MTPPMFPVVAGGTELVGYTFSSMSRHCDQRDRQK